MTALLMSLRKTYHLAISKQIIRLRDDSFPNFADRASKGSVAIAREIINLLGGTIGTEELSEQAAGRLFEDLTKKFLEDAFSLLAHIRPGEWMYSTNAKITDFDQYAHLAVISEQIRLHKELATVFGSEYIITPDIVIGRKPLSMEYINEGHEIPFISAEGNIAQYSPLRDRGDMSKFLLHASISCKWTLRSDRSQNVRTEALNLIRNRKGNLPHVAVVTAEPLPMRIASLAMGTGELDCVYHFALPELQSAVSAIGNEDQEEMLNTLIGGKRLRDISDLPLDLAI